MGQVVNLRAFALEKAEALEMSASVYGRMQSGDLSSVFYIARGPSGSDEVGVAGEFVADMESAKQAALAGFKAMFGHSIEAMPARRPLPRDLKRGTR